MTDQVSTQDIELVRDLDAIVQKPRAFTLQGQRHIIEPITTQAFMEASAAFATIEHMQKSKQPLEPEKVIDAYFQLFRSVCKTMTMEIVRKMNLAQCAGLYAEILSHITGDVENAPSVAQKKNLMVQ